MTPLDISIFFNDPWWIVLIKVVGIVLLLLHWTIVNVWYERRLVGKMQHRLGPIMNPTWLNGLGQALGDGMKLLFKEDFAPSMVDRFLFSIAPLIAGGMAFTAWSVIPLGGEVNMFGVTTKLQVTDLPVSGLLILAVASVAIYGFVLAGWSSHSPYSLIGALRSSAQMISYELSMGLSFVAVFLYSGTMSTSEIVEAQAAPLSVFGVEVGLQSWYWLLLAPSFIIYFISMVGETNRAPFDLPECESELVSGHLTEYSGFRYAIFFLAEYINMATVSAVATTLFLGGYHAPWPFALIPGIDSGYWGLLWFLIKVQLLISVFVWLRGTLPRFRYDQFMDLGWKWMIPISIVWVVFVATVQYMRNTGGVPVQFWWIGAGVIALILIGLLVYPSQKVERITYDMGEYTGFVDGYPVPPMPGQTLPEFADVVSGTATESGADAASGEDK